MDLSVITKNIELLTLNVDGGLVNALKDLSFVRQEEEWVTIKKKGHPPICTSIPFWGGSVGFYVVTRMRDNVSIGQLVYLGLLGLAPEEIRHANHYVPGMFLLLSCTAEASGVRRISRCYAPKTLTPNVSEILDKTIVGFNKIYLGGSLSIPF